MPTGFLPLRGSPPPAFSSRNAEYQVLAQQVGTIGPLSPGEIEKAAIINTQTTGLMRAWDYWVARLAKRNAGPAIGGPVKRAAAKRVAVPKRGKTVKAAKRPAKGRKR